MTIKLVVGRGTCMKDKLLHMRDKLNDISKRNRSIRLLKLYNKWSFDLAELDKKIEEGLSEQIVQKVLAKSKKGYPFTNSKNAR